MNRHFDNSKFYWLNGSGYIAFADAPIEYLFIKGDGAATFAQDGVDAEKESRVFAAVANDRSLTRAIDYYERAEK